MPKPQDDSWLSPSPRVAVSAWGSHPTATFFFYLLLEEKEVDRRGVRFPQTHRKGRVGETQDVGWVDSPGPCWEGDGEVLGVLGSAM